MRTTTAVGATTAAETTDAAEETAEADEILETIAFMWGGFGAPFVAPRAKSFTETATAAGAKVVNFDNPKIAKENVREFKSEFSFDRENRMFFKIFVDLQISMHLSECAGICSYVELSE